VDAVTRRTWPLFLIALPAAVAVWSGWVGLAALSGFGVVKVLPGITSWTIDTAICLPIGVESYGILALGAWLSPEGVSDRARTFARRSALASLGLGALGQVGYHLLTVDHATRAPWPVVVLVSVMPVAVLGLGAALIHLLRAGEASPDSAPEPPWTDAAPQLPEAVSNGSRAGGWLS
jgi:cytochrome bd-type quinol oxidase subunit 2